jgi:hypothetical protein
MICSKRGRMAVGEVAAGSRNCAHFSEKPSHANCGSPSNRTARTSLALPGRAASQLRCAERRRSTASSVGTRKHSTDPCSPGIATPIKACWLAVPPSSWRPRLRNRLPRSLAPAAVCHQAYRLAIACPVGLRRPPAAINSALLSFTGCPARDIASRKACRNIAVSRIYASRAA